MAEEMFKTTLMGGFDKDDVQEKVQKMKDETAQQQLAFKKERDRNRNGSSHAGLLLYSVKGGSRGNGETERCIREYTGRTGDSGRCRAWRN